MKPMVSGRWAALLLLGLVTSAPAQQATSTDSAPSAQSGDELSQRIQALSRTLAVAQERLAQSERDIGQMQLELQQLREQVALQPGPATTNTRVPHDMAASGSSSSITSPLEERQQALEAAVKLHEQTKVESASKYPLRVTGLILFNGFVNKGVADNSDLPAVALRQTVTSGSGSVGAGLRQTVLGLEGDGPVIAGAHTLASIDLDFFSGVSYSDYGTSAGVVRMRTANVAMNWPRDLLEVGLAPPLISPLSPTSFATVAQPALSGAGNLWTWAPQLRYAHRFGPASEPHLQLELALWDSAAAGYNSNQFFRTASPAEDSNQPSYETRISYTDGKESGRQFGASGYYSRQTYPGYSGYPGVKYGDSWAGAFDFRTPIWHFFEISGEGYRGRSLGGLGGGVYKDIISGLNPATGQTTFRPLNAVGGWAQWKTSFTQSLQTNVSVGLDDGFARDFHAILQSSTASATQLRARNRMAIANLIYSPKTYIILSPEYRRIWSWPIDSKANTIDVFTFSVGYRF